MPKLVKSVYDDQDELLAAMVGLHSGGAVECDPTYGRGLFYRYVLEPPRLRFDIAPRRRGVVAANVRRLPLRDAAVGSVMFDPPFLNSTKSDGKSAMREKYREVVGNTGDLLTFYGVALAELFRVLRPGGILYFKCQDTAHDRQQAFVHIHVHNEAVKTGFVARDFFILLAKSRPIQHNLYRQIHARKYHCYFWVFEKRGRTR